MKEAMDFGCTFCGKTSWTGEELVTRSVCLDKTTTRVNNYCMLTAFGNTWFPYDMPMDISVTSICPSRLINRQITSCGLHKCKKLCTMTSHQSIFLHWIVVIITPTLLRVPWIQFKTLFYIYECTDTHAIINDRIIIVLFPWVPTVSKIPPLIPDHNPVKVD